MTTDIPEVVARLRALHEHDENIRRLEEEIHTGPTRLADIQRRVGAIEKKIRALQERMMILKAQIKLRENDLGAAEQKIERIRAQSSEVKTNKEFVAYKAELSNYQADADRLQGEILKILEVVEQGQKKVESLQVDRAEAERKVQEAQARLDESLKDVKQQCEKLVGDRADLKKGIPAEVLENYERVRLGRGAGVARLEGDYCGGCMEHLTRNEVFAVVNLSRLITCRACNRIVLP